MATGRWLLLNAGHYYGTLEVVHCTGHNVFVLFPVFADVLGRAARPVLCLRCSLLCLEISPFHFGGLRLPFPAQNLSFLFRPRSLSAKWSSFPLYLRPWTLSFFYPFPYAYFILTGPCHLIQVMALMQDHMHELFQHLQRYAFYLFITSSTKLPLTTTIAVCGTTRQHENII